VTNLQAIIGFSSVAWFRVLLYVTQFDIAKVMRLCGRDSSYNVYNFSIVRYKLPRYCYAYVKDSTIGNYK